jgi:hypothetical protein
MQLNLLVQSTNKLFEIPGNLSQYRDEDFFGLFWGEQQPFVSSGYGGLYFFWAFIAESYLGQGVLVERQLFNTPLLQRYITPVSRSRGWRADVRSRTFSLVLGLPDVASPSLRRGGEVGLVPAR